MGEGYTADAKVVGECLKMMNGEKVAMATMDMEVEGKKYCKVKPKFKVGDFILNGDVTDDGKKEIFKIRNVCSDWYNVENIYDSRPSILTFTQEWSCRLWNISDARDGDVLAIDWIDEDTNIWEKVVIFKSLSEKGVEGYGNTFKNKEKVFNDSVPYYSKTWTKNLHPATTEQRDLLFKEMRKSGYRWDANKKELEKIVIDEGKDEMDYCFTKMMLGEPSKNSEWSEEDDRIVRDITNEISYIKGTAMVEQYKHILDGEIDWLKGLKKRILKKG